MSFLNLRCLATWTSTLLLKAFVEGQSFDNGRSINFLLASDDSYISLFNLFVVRNKAVILINSTKVIRVT